MTETVSYERVESIAVITVDRPERRNAIDDARELAELVARFPQETVRTDRAAVYDGLGSTLEQRLASEGWHGSRAMETAASGADRFASGEGRGGEGVPDDE